MQTIELNELQILLLSDTLQEKAGDLRSDIQCSDEAIRAGGMDPDTDEIHIEIQQDLAVTESILLKLNQ